MNKSKFPNYAKWQVSRSSVSDMYPLLSMIGKQWGLNIWKESDYKIAEKILINSVKNN